MLFTFIYALQNLNCGMEVGAPRIDGQWMGPTRPHTLRMPKNGTGSWTIYIQASENCSLSSDWGCECLWV